MDFWSLCYLKLKEKKKHEKQKKKHKKEKIKTMNWTFQRVSNSEDNIRFK
jgi:hypothetical protein